MSKKGQLNISFGMIFSIILIIVFLAFGFYAIKKMLELQSEVQINQFLTDLENDIDKIWKSNQGISQVKSYSLPEKIDSVCFQEDEFENLKFKSKSIIHGTTLQHIDMTSTLPSGQEELCFPNVKNKVSMRLVKDYGETLITIAK